MGLESISKTGTIHYDSSAAVTTGVTSTGGSAQTSDYTASQTAVVPDGQTGAVQAEAAVSLADVKDISKVLNSNTVAEFGIYEPMNRITIKIKDKETGEVLREVPSEKMLKMFTKACELAGILVDEKM